METPTATTGKPVNSATSSHHSKTSSHGEHNQSGLYKLDEQANDMGIVSETPSHIQEKTEKKELPQEELKASDNNTPQKEKLMRVSSIQSSEDSLKALINSDLFTVHMLFQHLQKSLNDSKMPIVDHIINHKLRSEPVQFVDFYLPQLCYMVLTKTPCTPIIVRFLLETAIKHRNIGLKALQMFQSFSEDSGAVYQDRAMEIYEDMEQSLVNGDLPQKKYGRIESKEEFDLNEFCDKRFKADYLTYQIKFADQLKYLSIKLKTLPLNDRTTFLKKKLEELNSWIADQVRSQLDTIPTQSKFNYNGVILPFENGDDSDPSIIMNVVPDLGIPFDTKKRAPFKVVFETVKLSELKSGQSQQSSQKVTPDIVEPEYPRDIEVIREIFLEYAGSLGIDLTFQQFDSEIAGLPGKYAKPQGCILLAKADLGKTIGCVALRPLEHKVCEMKRLYVKPEYQGNGIGKALAVRICELGKEMNYEKMRVDTLETMKPALAIYTSLGFQRTEAYIFNPLDGAVWMELDLTTYGEQAQQNVQREPQEQMNVYQESIESPTENILVNITQADDGDHMIDNPFGSTTFRTTPTQQNEELIDQMALENLCFEELKQPIVESTPGEPVKHGFKTTQSMKYPVVLNDLIKQDLQSKLAENNLEFHSDKASNEVDQDFTQVNQLIEKFANNRRSSSLNAENSMSDHSSNFASSEAEARLDGMMDPFKESQAIVEARIKKSSQLASYKTHSLKMMIVKANDDLRQENLAIQLMQRLHQIFDQAGLKNSIYLRPYEIFITSSNSGMIEFIPDTISLDTLKKRFPKKPNTQATTWTLKTFYKKYFGDNFEEAQKNFVESLAGYSLYNYLFNVKDRHNANIMIDSVGHLVHIDFGFMFQSAPGGITFERAPFKLTAEYVELMDGVDSEIFQYFKSLMIRGFFEIRKNLDDILVLIEILMKDSRMPCIKKPKTLIAEIRDRMSLKYNTGLTKENDYFELVDRLVKDSMNAWSTTQYDNYQKMTNGIEK